MNCICRVAGVVLMLTLPSSAATPSNSEAAFKKLQTLVGDWTGTDQHGMEAKSSFKLIVSNTTLMETLSGSGMEEMVTFYHLDGNAITLVHYCPTNNQPRMRAVPTSGDVKELVFRFEGAGNLPSLATGHQHQLTLHFDDPDHISETWVWRENGRDTPMVIHLTRKKT